MTEPSVTTPEGVTRRDANTDTAASGGTGPSGTGTRPADGDHDEEGPGYHGPATVVADGCQLAVTARLLGRFEPIDGRYRWYGRLDHCGELDRLTGDRARQVVLRTPFGSADATLSDRDPWGRPRVTGVGTPPFTVWPDDRG